MISKIKNAILKIDQLSATKPIKVVSHYDTDGITAAAIFSKALQRWHKKFSLEVVKSLEEEYIKNLPEDSILIFLDLASNSLHYLKEKKTEVFILDHHEVISEIPENVTMINPLLDKHELLSGAGVCYLFAKTLSPANKDLATLALIGMVGDLLDKNRTKSCDELIKDSNPTIKRGLLLYPSTRPVDRVLEYSSSMYIPGVTGSYKGVLELLKDAGINKIGQNYKSLHELTEDEMSKLITAIMLRGVKESAIKEMIGDIYLVKFFNKMEDARELSALINACSRMGHPYVSLGFCLGNQECKKMAEKIHITYKQQIISALKYIPESDKISGKNYTIINARDNIKDTIIGTITSIISHSPTYPEGTVIIALAYNENKIKVSARLAGREGRNLREVLNEVVVPLGGEVGGHPNAAGCLISKEKENIFLQELKRVLDIEVVKI